MYRNLLFIFVVSFFIYFGGVSQAFAQSATGSGTATNSGTATQSATATSSTTTATTSSATTLPQTGAHDVLILFSAGVIFLMAGITVLSGTRKVFADFE